MDLILGTCADHVIICPFRWLTGDWHLHLYAVKQMLLYLHAAGHLHYAKSVHLYVCRVRLFYNPPLRYILGWCVVWYDCCSWIKSSPLPVPLCNNLESFVAVNPETLEQHKKLRTSRQIRDNHDADCFIERLEAIHRFRSDLLLCWLVCQHDLLQMVLSNVMMRLEWGLVLKRTWSGNNLLIIILIKIKN